MTQSVSGFDIDKLCREAQIRWLKATEVLFILQNHEKLKVNYKTPQKPPSGSIFLFNRRVHRNFRNDGHLWRKKPNGKSIREGHERLKVGSLEVLNCYYAHGEKNSSFQRRSYWMLNPAFEHIVFVHYREVNEGRCIPESILSISNDSYQTLRHSNSTCDAHIQDTPSQNDGLNDACQNSCSPGSLEEVNSEFVNGYVEMSGRRNAFDTDYQPPLQEYNQALRRIEMHLNVDEDDNTFYSKETSPPCEESQIFQLLNDKTRDSSQETLEDVVNGFKHITNDPIEEVAPEYSHILTIPDVSGLPGSPGLLQCISEIDTCGANSIPLILGTDDNVFIDENGVSSVSFFPNPWLEQSQLEAPLENDSSLTATEGQWFNISEVSPEWAFSSESAKVIITGCFLCNSSDYQWFILFGDQEVRAEIVDDGVLCCLTPQHTAGKVNLCVTSGNRQPCSQVQEFEFRPKLDASSSCDTFLQTDAIKSTDELLLLVKLVHIILNIHSTAPVSQERHLTSETNPLRKSKETEDLLTLLSEELLSGTVSKAKVMDSLLQELIKDKLWQLLSSKCQNSTENVSMLSKQEQCIIHLISGLGYDWALNLILDSGIGVNFRDPNGWTALHWAACYGREQMVTALLAAGALAGAQTDPTVQDPAGKTPADLASANGHKGLAAFLSEEALTRQYFSVKTLNNGKLKRLASLEGHRGVESINQKSAHLHDGADDERTLKYSLSAVKNAAQAAARIQSAFRAYSFRKKQQKATQSHSEYGVPLGDIHKLSVVTRSHRTDQKYDKAAISIQKNYRRWKKRKEFLTMRKHVVKLQTHVRTHLARKKYKKFLQSVSIMEKIILRWHKKGVGLRGFHAEQDRMDDSEEDDILIDFRKQKVEVALKVALSRVQSMVGYPEARQQYCRLLETSQKSLAQAQVQSEDEHDPMDMMDNHCSRKR